MKIKKIVPQNRALFPLYTSAVSGGFPSPADDHLEETLDLHEHLIEHPAATFFVRVEGNSMIGEGITDGDMLIVDRSLDAEHGNIVIAAVDGDLTVKRLEKKGKKILLVAANPDYPAIEMEGEMEMVVWGVVTSVIRSLV